MLGAIMLFAAMACDTSYMHSWGSIFVQDVLLPIRQIMNRPALSPEDHLRWLRRSIIGVGVFAFVFGILWTQDEYILNFFAVTAAIFLGGAGSCIVGGLYWKRGTTAGAWAGMIVGSSLAVSGMVAKQIFAGFPINGQYVFTIAMVSSIATYTLVSLATCRKPHDMDKLLHRGRYAVDPVTGEPLNIIRRPDSTWRGIIGIDDESSTIDKFQCLILFSWGAAWTIAFAVVTLWNLFWKWPTSWWVNWTLWTSVILAFVISTGTTIWFTFGGVRDLRRLFVRLRKVVVNDLDDGRVADGASEGRETPGARGELELAQQPLSSPRAKG
jgi:solute:Na+ symporter, SSS family